MNWVGPTIAIALVVIALVYVSMAVILVLMARGVAQQGHVLGTHIADLRRDLTPTIQAVNRFAHEGEEMTRVVREEVTAVVDASRRVRRQVQRGLRRAEQRLSDLDALYEVVQGEVEETALDVAATLRGVRTGAGMVGRIRRWLVRGRR